MKLLSRIISVLFVSTMLIAAILSANPAKANPEPSLVVLPPSIIDHSINVGDVIVINASVIDVTDLYAWQIMIQFNPIVLNCTGAVYPPDHIFAGNPYIPVAPVIDPVGGSVSFGASLIGAISANGNGTLCQIAFRVLSKGASGLNFASYGSDTFLLDSNLNIIQASTVNGYFENGARVPPVAQFTYEQPVLVNVDATFDASTSYDSDGTIVTYHWEFGDSGSDSGEIVTHQFASIGTYDVNLTVTDNDGLSDSEVKQVTVYESRPARLYVDPPEIINSTLFPPAVVTINITVDDVLNMYDYEFNLTYNTEMLTCIGAIINRVQEQTAFTPMLILDDGAGFIWVRVDYHLPAIPISTNTPLALVTIFFQVDAPGSSILHLSETELSNPANQPMPHETGDGFIMTLIRDVEVTQVGVSTNWAYQGWPVDIAVSVRNKGNISETFSIKVYYDGNLAGTLDVVNLAVGEEVTLNLTWDTSGVPEGNYTISAEATAVPFEYDLTNNYKSDGVVQIFTSIRDVAIMDVAASRSWAYKGMLVNITVNAKNLGEVTESFDIRVYYDSNLIETRSVTNLLPGEEIIQVFTWNTSNIQPCHNYTISAEATLVPFEFNATNNNFIDGDVKIRYVGDINGDGKVDMMDVGICAAAFGSYPGHPRWNPNADITGPIYLVPDNVVDMRDVSLVARNFGIGC